MSESNFNRRDFLKSACISVGALSLSGCGDTDKSKGADGGNEGGLPSVDVLVIGSGGAGLRAAVAVSAGFRAVVYVAGDCCRAAYRGR